MDYSQDTPDTQSNMPPPQLVAALRQILPNADDQTILAAWKQASEQNPQVAKTDPQTLALGVMRTLNQPAQPATQTPAPVQATQANLNVPPAPTDPFAGSGYTQADLMKQYNPSQVKQAFDTRPLENSYQQQSDWFNQTNPQRQAAAFFQAQVPGSTAGADFAKGQEAQTMLQTIGKQATLLGINQKQQEALQKAATEGLAAGKSAVDIANDVQKGFGMFADNVVKGLTTQQQQRFDDPNSPETKSLKIGILGQAQTLDPETQKGVLELANTPGVTARQLLTLSATTLPSVFDAFTKAAGIGKTVQETAGLMQGQETVAQRGGAPVPSRTVPQVGTSNAAPTTAPAGTSNNVGNIRPLGASTGFQSFKTPEEGIAAVDNQLKIYGDQHGVNTLRGAIARWSPPNENKTDQLVATAAQRLGINPDQKIDLSNPVQRHAVATAIMMQENNIFKPTSAPMSIGQVAAPEADAGRGNVNPPMAGFNKLDNYVKSGGASITLPPAGQGWNDALYGPKPSASQIYSSNVTASSTGGASVTPDAYQASKKVQTAQELDQTQKFLTNYDSGVAGNIGFVLKNATPEYAGRVAQLGSKIKNEPVGQKMANSAASINEAAQELGIMPGKTSSNAAQMVDAAGNLVGSIPHAGAIVAGKAAQTLASSVGTISPVSAESPPEVLKDAAVRVSIAKAQHEAELPYKREYSENLDRNLDGYTATPIHKKIIDIHLMVPMINTDGKVELVDRANTSKLLALKRSGYTPAEQYLIK